MYSQQSNAGGQELRQLRLLASGGLSTATKVAGTTASESLLAAEKFAHMSANVYDAAQFGHDFMEDPQMALTNLATSQMIGRTIGHLGSKYKAYRASQTGNVDIHSGEATSFKTNLKEQANTAWTDIKTRRVMSRFKWEKVLITSRTVFRM